MPAEIDYRLEAAKAETKAVQARLDALVEFLSSNGKDTQPFGLVGYVENDLRSAIAAAKGEK